MRVPLSWLREFVDIGDDVDELVEVLTLGGLEVEAVERPTAGTRGVRVVEVLDVGPIEGSDKLSLVHATDGDETWEIVCGASNFAPGDRVPGALPGSVLQADFEITRRKIFGHVSNGMLASPRELGIGDDHAGIWVLDPDAPLGADVTDWLELDDPVLLLEVTPDRGYALSLHGIARDVAALTGATLRVPSDVADAAAPTVTDEPAVPVTIADADRCPRFVGTTIRGVQIGPSPAWLQRRLAAAGLRPLSNVVDATNAALLETGNPIHAYDLALLAGPAIEVRLARDETLVTLDGVERSLDADDLVICDADGPVALAGVMGGAATEISAATADVYLEVANFAAATVLRTARRHGLHTEGARRWERQVPPAAAAVATARCVELITRTAGGTVTAASDTYPQRSERPVITLRTAAARRRLGIEADAQEQAALLGRIACDTSVHGDDVDVRPPAYRPDLRTEADLHEEIVRVHGYERVPSRVPSTGQVGRRTPEHEARRVTRRALAGGGWTEVMPYPFIAASEIDALGIDAGDRRRETIPLVNPLSKEQAVLRTTLLPGLLRVVRHNVNRQFVDVAVFEIGHVFLRPTDDEPGAWGGPDGGLLPAEPLLLGLAACGAFEPGRHDLPARPADVFDVLGAGDLVRDALGRAAFDTEPTGEAPFHPGRAARVRVEGVDVGAVGELHPRIAAAFEVPPRTVVGELRLEPLLRGGVRPRPARVPSPLPGIQFDVAVIVEAAVPAADVEAAVRAGAGERASDVWLFDVYHGAQVGEGRKSLAYRVRLDDAERQLTDADEAASIERIEETVAERVGGHLRR